MKATLAEGGGPTAQDKKSFAVIADLPAAEQPLIVLVIDDSSGFRDEGQPPRRSTLNRVKEAVLATYNIVSPGAQVAVMFYDETTRNVVAFGARAQDVEQAVGRLSFSGQRTRTYAAIDAAVELLSNREGIRRQLLLFTDGVAEDASIKDAVLTRAQAAGVEISPLLVNWLGKQNAKRSAAESEFELLARRTLGVFGSIDRVGPPPETLDYISALRRQAAAGGVYRFPGAQSSVVVAVDLVKDTGGIPSSAPTLRATLEIAPPPAPVDPGPAEEVSPAEEAPPPADPPFWRQPWALPAAVAVVLALGLIATLAVAARRRQRRDAAEAREVVDPPLAMSGPDAAVTTIAPMNGVGGANQARLVFESDGSDVLITTAKVSIGRSSRNDVVIPHKSVSRIHSELHRTRDGDFAITDLGSFNKTRVNGEVVATRTLLDGDRIKLGNVELTYRSASG